MTRPTLPPLTEAQRLADIETGRVLAETWLATHGLEGAEQRLAICRVDTPSNAAFFVGFLEVVEAARTTTA